MSSTCVNFNLGVSWLHSEIVLIKGKLEDIELPVKSVDIIISEVCSPNTERVTLWNRNWRDISGWGTSCCTNLCWTLFSSLVTSTSWVGHCCTFSMDRIQLTLQAPGGLLFPDKATIFLAAIEDQDYKEEKINCKLGFSDILRKYKLILSSLGGCLRIRLLMYQRYRTSWTTRWLCRTPISSYPTLRHQAYRYRYCY